jgi:hypothetical protein
MNRGSMPHTKSGAPKKPKAKRRRAAASVPRPAGTTTTKRTSGAKDRNAARVKTTAAPTAAKPSPLPDERAYAVATVVRGEAAVPDASGTLAEGVTHEIVSIDEFGVPEIKRRRFSAV